MEPEPAISLQGTKRRQTGEGAAEPRLATENSSRGITCQLNLLRLKRKKVTAPFRATIGRSATPLRYRAQQKSNPAPGAWRVANVLPLRNLPLRLPRSRSEPGNPLHLAIPDPAPAPIPPGSRPSRPIRHRDGLPSPNPR